MESENLKTSQIEILITLDCTKRLSEESKENLASAIQSLLQTFVDDTELQLVYLANCTFLSKEATMHIRTPVDASTVMRLSDGVKRSMR